MTIEFTHRNGARRLLLIFAGWGMDARPFAALRRPGYDVAVVYDYRTYDFGQVPDCYDEVCIVAWSFGVAAAADFMAARPELHFTLRVAVNGTLTPVDDLTGIPRAIFDGTLAGLDERSLLKFYRRMCGSTTAFAAFSSSMPVRQIDELADELRAIDSRESTGRPIEAWDHVMIGSADAIIPAANQQRAWESHPSVEIIADGAHLVDFSALLDRLLIDKELVGSRFSGSQATYDSEADVQRRMAHTLADLFAAGRPTQLRDVIEAGPGTGFLTLRIAAALPPGCRFTLWDLAPIDASLPGEHRRCDAEAAIRELPDASVDAVVSAATMQWFNAPLRFIAEAYRALRPGGTIAVSTFGDLNFRELAPFATRRAGMPADILRRRLAAYGIDATVSESIETRRFDSPHSLLRHISLTGVNASESDSRRALRSARALIEAGVSELTYHPIYITVRKPL